MAEIPAHTESKVPEGLRFMLRALRWRNYRLFFMGQGTSLIGTWLSRTATGWLVLRLTDSPLLLGVVGFAGQIPTFLLAPFAGVMVDRLNRHRVLVATQVLAMVQSFLLAWFALRGTIRVPHILVLSIVQGLINAFDIPARQAFVVEMVEDREDLSNAIALNSSMVNGARLLGPSIAGVLIAAVGEGWCFMIDAISYVAVVASLLAMRLKERAVGRKNGRVMAELKEGFRYAFGFGPIRAVLVLLAIVSLMGMPYTVLMPVFARDILKGGPLMLGWLMAASGFGALAGAVWLASRRSVLGLGRVIAVAAAVFGAALVGFAISRQAWLSVALLLVSGFAMIVQMASSNTVLQTIVDDDKRGRVMSIYTMAFMGMAPFGSLLAGLLAQRLGAPVTVVVGGACCIIAAAFFARRLPALRRLARPIYARRGILPEMATGLQSATSLTTPPEE